MAGAQPELGKPVTGQIRMPTLRQPESKSDTVSWPLEIWIPGKPVPKARARHGRTHSGRSVTYSDPKTQTFELQVGMLASVAMGASEPHRGPFSVEVDVGIACPSNWSQKRREEAYGGEIAATKRPDVDNYLKSLIDGMNGVVFADDSQITVLQCRKRYARRPGVMVIVKPVTARRAP